MGNPRNVLTREGRNCSGKKYFLCEGKVDMVTIDKEKYVFIVTYLTIISSEKASKQSIITTAAYIKQLANACTMHRAARNTQASTPTMRW